jgi:hypothetical protein
LIVNEIKVGSLKEVSSISEIDVLYRRAFPSGNEGIVWILMEQKHLYPYLLLAIRIRELLRKCTKIYFNHQVAAPGHR